MQNAFSPSPKVPMVLTVPKQMLKFKVSSEIKDKLLAVRVYLTSYILPRPNGTE
jgi:hypothetical protein